MRSDTRDRTEQQGRASTDHLPDSIFALVLDRTSDGVLLADSDGVIVHVNQPLLDLFGYAADELVGRRVEILIPEDLRDEHRGHVEAYAERPRPRPMGRKDLDIEGRRADGSTFPIDVQLNALPDQGLVVATVRDMTAERAFAAECALGRIDLAHARVEVSQLRESLDLVIQRLFGLGMSMSAGASNDTLINERMAKALLRIDEIIEAVQTARRAVGPATPRTSGP